MSKVIRPVRPQHPRLARILSLAGALVLFIGLATDSLTPQDESDTLQLIQFGLIVCSIVFAHRTLKIKTQAEFDRWAIFIIGATNAWILVAAWNSGFSAERVIGLFLIINISFYLIPDKKIVGIYAGLMAAAAAIAAFSTAMITVSPLILLSTLYFYLLIGVFSMRKILSDRDRLESSEEVLTSARDRAEEAVRSRNEFMTNMSHELRTPLNGIIGMASLLEQSKLEKSQKEMVDTIEMSSQLLLTLINDILDYAKLEATGTTIEVRENDIESCSAQCIDLVMPLALKKDVGLYLDIDPGTPETLVFDSVKVSQILVNLLNNAVKFTDEGEVRLAIALETADNKSAILSCYVIDSGVGIPDEQKQLIFEEFSQGDLSVTRRFGGTGLGLTICRKLLEAMGGSIAVESEVGAGSTFIAKIPVDTVVNEQLSSPIAEKQSHLNTFRCMLITENETRRNILKKNLEYWGVETYTGNNPDSSTAQLADAKQNNEKLPEFIICEFEPGDQNLHQLQNDLNTLYATTPHSLIVLSSNKENNYRIEDNLTIVNPVRMSALKIAMEKLLPEQSRQRTSQVPEQAEPEARTQAKFKILVAEDNQINQKVASSMLSKLGYTAELAGNGIEALELVKANQYDVVLMDIQMPMMDGLTATREIRKLSMPQPTIIAMTANAFEQDKKTCIDAGMDSFVAKPVSLDELRSALNKADQ